MTEIGQVYKCNICGNIVAMVHGGKGQLVCCGQPMVLQAENTVDASKEKHVPVAEAQGDKVVVKVGSAPHPMEEKHYIEWVELKAGDRSCWQFLKPGQAPEAVFENVSGPYTVRAYCNLHGLWKLG
ncbi:MAG: desulfoferrodoxin [Desulfurispora sp.]|uniref:desulfoferrodoxin n=1 Tax=Desulfurispora sp. TaxID=3014275 RepID=UPI00404928D6